MRSFVGALKLSAYLSLTLLLIPVQWAVMRTTKGPGIFAIPKFYHSLCCKIMGIRVIVEGNIETAPHTIYMSNHLSYLDITVISSVLPACFMAKKDVAGWPLFGTLARLQNTLFVSRNPRDASTAKIEFEERLKSPLPLIIFPEGTSSNGSSVLPFKSSLFEPLLMQILRVQPFAISLLEVDGKKPVSDEIRDLYAYHGEITLLPHFWNFFKMNGCTLKLTFQKSLSTNSYNDRKSLSNHVRTCVVEGLDLSTTAA